MASFIDWLTVDILNLLIEIDGMEAETVALYNTFVISVSTTVITLLVGGVIQAFFNLFGAFFNSPKVKKGR